MRLQSIELSGFRGFTKRQEFDLDADAVVVIGANGHGKTSLFDGILWALSGRIPRLKSDDSSFVSMYSETGQARVALRLKNGSNGNHFDVTRSFDGKERRITLETSDGSYQGPSAEGKLIDLVWSDAVAASDPSEALASVLTRSIYLQQDLIRQFIDAASPQERFSAVSELVGAGRVTELQDSLERSKKAWSTVTNQRQDELRPVRERLAIIEARLSESTERSSHALPAITSEAWGQWWQNLAQLGLKLAQVESASREAPSAISNAIKELDAQRRLTERRLQNLGLLQADIRTERPILELQPLRDNVTKMREEVEDLKRVTAEEQARLAELRRHQAELKEKSEQLKALAVLALKHLTDHCPVCDQTYDKEITRQRLEILAKGGSSDQQTISSPDKLNDLFSALTAKEKEVSASELALRSAEQAVNERQMTRQTIIKRLAELGVGAEDNRETALARAVTESETFMKRLGELQQIGESLALRLAQSSAMATIEELRREADALRSDIAARDKNIAARNRTGDLAQNVIEALREAASAVVEERLREINPRCDRRARFMRLHRLRIVSFAAIGNVDVEFGPGLNVLYGPNDLGKSTVVAAIRLGLLLPHTSTHCDQYVGWTGSDDPIVEMTFETEAQRIWRIRKQFGKGGSSLLQESRNGRDFDDVERGRKVDGKLREILRWGIPEPGGTGGAKGLPTSFLATALLSPQGDVSAILSNSLQNDPTGSGKEQIAAALQAVAQDPLFVALLRETQARRDAAYTDKGAKKTARGSVFKAAADRLNETRDEKEKLQRIVADSEGAERQLRELTDRRALRQEALAVATDLVANLEGLASQATCRSASAEQLRMAEEDVLRIKRIGTEVETAEREVAELVGKITEAEQALNLARGRQVEADAALEAAEKAAHAEESDPGVTDTVVRQQLELRKSAADQSAREAQQRIDAASSAQKLVEAVAAAERELRDQQAKADSALDSASKATAAAKKADDELQRCDLLERALDVHAADKQAEDAQAAVDNEAALRTRLEATSGERAVLATQRSAITVPILGALGPMRKLARDLAAARGALDVGFVVTVTPKARLDLRVQKDGQEVDSTSTAQPLDIEANAEVEVAIADIATVRVRGGRRAAQEKAKGLEDRWSREAAPHLIAAVVTDLDGLDAKIAEAQEMDGGIKAKDAELESLRAQIDALAGAAEALREASGRAEACRTLLGDVGLDTLAADLKGLGADGTAGLRKRRQQLSKEAEAVRGVANQATNDRTLADERTRNSRLALDAAVAARDAALAAFPEGVDKALVAARAALAAGIAEKEKATAEFASLEHTIDARKKRIDAALSGARTDAAQATTTVETAQGQLTTAKTNHASAHGRLIELRKQREAENLAAAETRLHEATERHAALPVPDRIVTEDEVSAARNAAAGAKLDLEGIERDIQRAHGALEQVGGAVARERLRDATEAFELAERQEREIEAEYEAWRLLLDQMKEADAAQASNLGQALVPAIAGRFQELTQRRYQAVQLTAQLATEGIVVSGAVRPTALISVGTREQLSTLYRLSLAEYLGTTIVLDDQLVQSDDNRMDWFRALLTEKAHSFQIVVFTCRPGDYLLPSALVPQGSAVHADTDGGFIRAVDLGRALRRR